MSTSPMTFISEVRNELAKVTYPTRKEVIRLTGVVLGVCLIVAAFLASLDYLFSQLMQLLLTIKH